ncbi:lipid-A-disaccharide synthase [Orenia metallireducens]|uniref:Lipid-A-disaccharide synthase n=1 Tax=Orenia metallireducens TaxID=1413210 RepID=A0A285GL38_9FIRM|nr:lipid-A-disaccharide synthase [Orenia metallireducens]PRX35724.1 lipid-A-disaccharide synthase [Orenia metallireducens]SNY24340.1 lipid-A-disaccharide synthase [Orenia metallireducens]
MPKIMVIAGEVSGDMHAAKVIKEMKKLHSNLEFIGIGGRRMESEGVELIYDPTKLSTIGFIEAIKHLKLAYKILNKLDKAMKEEKPDVILLVDYSGFNMKVAKIAHKHRIPAVNYFAPSAWVWGKGRAKTMAKRQVKIASVFPMEEKVYRQAGADVEFVGHPILDLVEPELSKDKFQESYDINSDNRIIGLLPGSRQQEIEGLLTPMLEAAQEIKKSYENIQFLLPLADSISREDIKERIESYNLDINLIAGHSYEVMEIADLLLVASGTATLEATCFQTPMVIVYKTSKTTYWLGKLLVKLPYIGLPNIIAEDEIVPELLQDEVTGQRIAKEAIAILNSPKRVERIKAELRDVVVKLGESGATKRVASLVLSTGGII